MRRSLLFCLVLFCALVAAASATATSSPAAKLPRPPPAGDDGPIVLERAQAAPIVSQIEPLLARAFDVKPGGTVAVEHGEIACGWVDGREIVAFEQVRIRARGCEIDRVRVTEGVLVVKGLAIDLARLRQGAVVVVGTPTVTPFITVDRKLFVDELAKYRVKDISVTFDKTSMILGGRVSFLLLSFPFRVRGHFELLDHNIAYVIDELRIKGKPAGPQRTAQLQSKTKELIVITRCLAALGVARVEVRSGRVVVRSGDSPVHTRDL